MRLSLRCSDSSASPVVFRSDYRRGFTLVELLVVIAIIGILIALLLPAVQAARDAARRTQCCDNLKNLSLGVLSYEAAKKTIPPGKLIRKVGNPTDTGSCGDPTQWDGYQTNWALEILPFIEESALYKRYRFDQGLDFADNLAVIRQQIPIMSCPADPNPPSLQTPGVGNPGNAMTGSYKGVSGRSWALSSSNEAFWDSAKSHAGELRAQDRGPLPVVVTAAGSCPMTQLAKSYVKIKNISDGMSKTLLIGEYTTTTMPTASSGSRSAFWGYSIYNLNLGSITLPETCKTNPNCSTVVSNFNYATQFDADFSKCENTVLATLGTSTNSQALCRHAFAGVHPGGTINFALCDGSVKRISNLADVRILAGLCTTTGAESAAFPD